jgi:hypothetical protein
MPQNNKPAPPFSHATHNYNACYALKNIGGYDDWVVTTAFYSGMKFLEDKLFPGDYDHPIKHGENKEYKTFSLYVRDFGRMLGANKHKIMSELVSENIEDIDVVNSYEDLKQSCHTARYINYQVGQDRIDMSIEAIEAIKNHCV